MSGAQWSPERLNEMADVMERLTWRENADALRAFASVVSVLEEVAVARDDRGELHGRELVVEPQFDEHGDANYRATLSAEGRKRFTEAEGDTPGIAILALADALDAGRGDES